jgi:hypothetical protein
MGADPLCVLVASTQEADCTIHDADATEEDRRTSENYLKLIQRDRAQPQADLIRRELRSPAVRDLLGHDGTG